jgi:hypothetical protein
MDFSTTMVGLVLVALILLPILYFNFKKSIAKKQMLDAFKALAREKGIEIGQHEFWRDSVIGIDPVKKMVLYQRKNETENMVQIVRLEDVNRCEQVTISSTPDTAVKGEQRVIQRLDLRFTFKTKNWPDELLTFYDADKVLQLDDDIIRMSTWHKTIKNLL